MYNGKTKLIAKCICDNLNYSSFIPKKLSFHGLPLPEGWMKWAVYTSSEDSPQIKQLKQDINDYNEVADMICSLPGFMEEFAANKLALSRQRIEEKWGTEVARRFFSLKENLFTREFYPVGDLFVAFMPDHQPEYEVIIPDYGKVIFYIDDHNCINYRHPIKENCELCWNYADDQRDFAFSIWYNGLSDYCYFDEEEETIPGFSTYECWDQGRACMDVGGVDLRLVTCLELLEEHGYVRTYSVCPDIPHPCWFNTDKSDGSLDVMVLDLSYKDNETLCSKLELVIRSPEIFEGTKMRFSTTPDGKLCLVR